MVDREVDGPVWVVLGRSWGLCVRSWVALGALVGDLGPLLGPIWPKNAKNMATLKMRLFLKREGDLRPRGAVLSRPWGVCRRSWPHLGGSRGLCWQSWSALEASVGGLGPLSGPFVRGPGSAWGLCCRAWAVLGPLFGAMLVVLGRSWGLCWRSWLLFGPPLAVLIRAGPKKHRRT